MSTVTTTLGVAHAFHQAGRVTLAGLYVNKGIWSPKQPHMDTQELSPFHSLLLNIERGWISCKLDLEQTSK